jgi:enamine deaminase RidA (YjgF/YER057c/UK114 family)
MERIHSNPEGHWRTPRKITHSHGIRVGNMVFVGGQTHCDQEGNVLDPGDIVAQTRGAMENLKRILEDLGATMNDVVVLNTFYAGELTVDEWARCAEIRFGYFDPPGPTATGIRVGDELNIPGLKVEVNATAFVGD